MNPVILDSMLRIPLEALSRDSQRKIVSALTLRLPDNSYGGAGPATLAAWKIEGQYLCVPRNWTAAKQIEQRMPVKDERAYGSPINLKFLTTFRQGQKEFITRMVSGLVEDDRGTIGRAGCGFGKTVCATAAIAELDTTTLFVVHKEKLMTQFIEACEKFLDYRPGVVQGDTCDWRGKKICVGMIQSLHQRDYDPMLYSHFGLVMVDECLTGDALVLTDKGEIPIKDIPSSGSKSVLSFNEHEQLWESKGIVRWVPKGSKETVHLRTTDGSLRCTADHPIRTERGWVAASELEPGDRILSPVRASAVNASPLFDPMGSLGSTSLAIRTGGEESTARPGGESSKLERLSADVSAGNASDSESALSSPAEKRPNGQPTCQGTTEPEVPVFGSRRRFWDWFTEPFSAIAQSVNRTGPLTRGSIGRTEFAKQRGQTTKPSALRDFSAAAGQSKTLATVSCLESRRAHATPDSSRRYTSSASRKRSRKVGLKTSPMKDGPGGTKTTAQSAAAGLPSTPRGSRLTSAPSSSMSLEGSSTCVPESTSLGGGLTYVLTAPRLESGSNGCRSSQDRGWLTNSTRVVSVTPTGILEPVYDIEVEDNHNFVANGMLVHNCHRVAAPTFSDAISKFHARYRIGLTATPRRGDNMEDIFFWHLGEVAAVGRGQFLDCTVTVVEWDSALQPSSWMFRGRPQLSRLITALSKEDSRNNMIVDLIAKATAAGRKSLVLSDRCEHLEVVQRKLRKTFERNGQSYTVGIFAAGSTKAKVAQREAALKADVMCGTWAMASEGLDAPERDTVFFITPKADIEQGSGRIRRLWDGKKQPMIVDIFDQVSAGVVRGLFRKRSRFYRDSSIDKRPWPVRTVQRFAS